MICFFCSGISPLSAIFGGSEFRCEGGGKKQAIAEIPAQTVGLVTCLVRLGGELEPKRVNPIFSLPFLYSTLPISISSILLRLFHPVPARRDPCCWDSRIFFVLSEKRGGFV